MKCNNEKIKNYKTLGHIQSEAAYFRYFVPELIFEDKVLYLDADVIVNDSLQDIFNFDVTNHSLIAATDYIGEVVFNQSKNYFNSGVLLINNKYWRDNRLSQILIDFSDKYVNQLNDGDQGVLNIIFGDSYRRANRFFNYQVGCDYIFPLYNKIEFIENLNNIVPIIIHFNSPAKPWLNIGNTRFRELYWYYFHMDWFDVVNQ